MKRIGLFLLAVAMVLGVVSCGGGGGSTDADSSEFDPTGSEWQFLVTTASAGDTMYTLTFFDSNGNRAASGLFTAVSGSGASYSGSWTSSGSVMAGASAGNFVFTLTANTDTTGTIDYVTPEGSGSSAATRVDSTPANIAGTYIFSSATVNGTPEAISGSITFTSSGTYSGSVTTEEGTEPTSGTFTVDYPNITATSADGTIDRGVITDNGRTMIISQISDEGATVVLVLTKQ